MISLAPWKASSDMAHFPIGINQAHRVSIATWVEGELRTSITPAGNECRHELDFFLLLPLSGFSLPQQPSLATNFDWFMHSLFVMTVRCLWRYLIKPRDRYVFRKTMCKLHSQFSLILPSQYRQYSPNTELEWLFIQRQIIGRYIRAKPILTTLAIHAVSSIVEEVEEVK